VQRQYVFADGAEGEKARLPDTRQTWWLGAAWQQPAQKVTGCSSPAFINAAVFTNQTLTKASGLSRLLMFGTESVTAVAMDISSTRSLHQRVVMYTWNHTLPQVSLTGHSLDHRCGLVFSEN